MVDEIVSVHLILNGAHRTINFCSIVKGRHAYFHVVRNGVFYEFGQTIFQIADFAATHAAASVDHQGHPTFSVSSVQDLELRHQVLLGYISDRIVAVLEVFVIQHDFPSALSLTDGVHLIRRFVIVLVKRVRRLFAEGVDLICSLPVHDRDLGEILRFESGIKLTIFVVRHSVGKSAYAVPVLPHWL